MEKEIFLSVIIPAYNEERRLGKTLEAIDAYLKKQTYEYEVVVVSDGSHDRTGEMVSEYARTMNGLVLIDNKENHGKGYVVRQGMLAARGKFRLFMDADNSVPVEYCDAFLPHFSQGYDVVIASIELPGAKIEEHAAWYRRALGHYAKLLIRLLAIWEIHDTQRGFKLFSAQAATEIFALQTLTRWGFDIEVLVIAKKLGYRIKELPVVWTNSGESKVGISAYFTTLRDLLVVRKNMLLGTYRRRKE
ncbi:MAG: glycosyltransferase family 2 protein [Candidatus Azambacteria bacterium]|nr:glycosyltransferase family 2 protein [Candidatus Azambacteria bacterium]